MNKTKKVKWRDCLRISVKREKFEVMVVKRKEYNFCTVKWVLKIHFIIYYKYILQYINVHLYQFYNLRHLIVEEQIATVENISHKIFNFIFDF